MTLNPLTPPEANASRNGFAQSGSTQNGSIWSKTESGEKDLSPEAKLDELFGRIKELQMDKLGRSGGSNGLVGSVGRRGLVIESGDPLVLWWAKSFKSESPADVERQESYRRSRWGQEPEPKKIPATPYLEMHKEGKLMKPMLFSLLIGFCASLNLVASAQDASNLRASEMLKPAAITSGISAESKVEMTRAFADQHKQVLNFTKLNELLRANDAETTNKSEPAHQTNPTIPQYPKAS